MEELKRRKKELGLTFADLANLSGVPKRTIEDIFAGKTKFPRIDTLTAIREALGLDQKEKPPEISDGEKTLLELFNQVPADKQALVLEMIRVALKSQQ